MTVPSPYPDAVPPSDDAKRLLVAMHHCILIQTADGHRWLTTDASEVGIEGPPSLDSRLEAVGLPTVHAKVYGSFREALDRVDAAFRSLGDKTLLEQYVDLGGDETWGIYR